MMSIPAETPIDYTGYECLAGGGEMGAYMRSFNWSETLLGPVRQWPQSLRTSVSTCLNSRFAILIWWGPDLVMLYNDAYRDIIAAKHPAALGPPRPRMLAGDLAHHRPHAGRGSAARRSHLVQ